MRSRTAYLHARRQHSSASTMPHSLAGSAARSQSKQPRYTYKQRLSPTQEDFLADWCLNEEKAGRTPSKKQVAAFAKEILLEGGDDEPLSHHWIERYLKRNPRVRTKNSTLLESARIRRSTREAYKDFYSRLRYQINSKGIIPKNIANIDEHGIQELETRADKVIGDALTKQALVESSDDTT